MYNRKMNLYVTFFHSNKNIDLSVDLEQSEPMVSPSNLFNLFSGLEQ